MLFKSICSDNFLYLVFLEHPIITGIERKTSYPSLRRRRLEVVGTSCVSPSRAPVLSFARYFQAPATQARVTRTAETAF